MCKYCEHEILIGKYEVDFGVLGKCTIPLSVWTDDNDHGLYFDFIHNGRSVQFILQNINYCPMCGRKLEAADEKIT